MPATTMVCWRRMRGAHTVEFALTALAFFLIFFGIVEVSRLMWTWGMLNEATRRGARIAAVCNINDPLIYSATTLYPSGLTNANVVVEYQYLSAAGAWTTVQGATAYGARAAIRNSQEAYVRVRFCGAQDANCTQYTPAFAFIPGHPTFTAPSFETTLPAESLGWNPDRNCFTDCGSPNCNP